MRPRVALAAILLTALLAGTWPPGATAATPWEMRDVPRVVAVSDIHGAHEDFVATLEASGVLGPQGAWRAGRTQLVIVGDMLDRGEHSRRTMELLMRLEPEAAAAGGGVQVLVGNHELMNLVGDLRYVSRGEYAAFAAEETPAMREEALGRFAASGRGSSRDPEAVRGEFDERFPPGYFAHRAAFAPAGRYGSWLLGRPLMLRIDQTLFVHAGLSAALATHDIEWVNGSLRSQVREYLDLQQALRAAGLLDTMTAFYDVPERLAPFRADGSAPVDDARVAEQIERLLVLHDSLIHTSLSPLWYRGNVACPALVEQARLAQVLQDFGAERVVVGHTPTFQRRIWSRLGGRLLEIDGGMLRPYYGGQGNALVIEGERISAVYEGDSAALAVAAQPPAYGTLDPGLGPSALEGALADGAIVGRRVVGDAEVLSVRSGDRDIEAVFTPAIGRDRFLAEVAAYRLDRLLGLDMVPAAVARTVEGREGSLQYLPPGLISEAERAAKNAYIEAWCPLPDQFRAMYLFDALIYNEGRSLERISYARSSGNVVLTGHSAAFGTRSGLPRHLQDVDIDPGEDGRERLRALGSEPGRTALEDVLGKRRLKALLRRAAELAR